jgi:hypothetical protein
LRGPNERRTSGLSPRQADRQSSKRVHGGGGRFPNWPFFAPLIGLSPPPGQSFDVLALAREAGRFTFAVTLYWSRIILQVGDTIGRQ